MLTESASLKRTNVYPGWPTLCTTARGSAAGLRGAGFPQSTSHIRRAAAFCLGSESRGIGGTFVRRSLGDRRRDVRYDIHGDLLATFDSTQQLQIANIGLGGALVYAPSPLPLQSVHTARLVLGVDESDVRFRVRHVGPADGSDRAYVVGVEFLELSRAALFGIERLLAQSVDAQVEEL